MNIYISPNNIFYKNYIHLIIMAIERNWTKKNQQQMRQKGILVEKHHIIPASFWINSKRKTKIGWVEGDPNNPLNIVYLTAKEHYYAHWWLMFCFEGLAKKKMIFAFRSMNNWITGKNKNRYFDPEGYNAAKILQKNLMKESMTGCNNPHYGKKQSKESNIKRSKALSGKNHPMYGKHHSNESNEKNRLSHSLMNWLITDPYDKKYFVNNLRRFCRENNLNVSNMAQVAKGNYKQSLGWKCQKLIGIS